MEQSEKIDQLAIALNSAQKQIKEAAKDARANYGMYADINSVIDTIREPCFSNGLSVVQLPGMALDGSPTLSTQIMHTSGQWIRSETPLKCKDMNDPQKVGGAITYFRRYMLQAGFRIGGEDDDGESASKSEQQNQPTLIKNPSVPSSNYQITTVDDDWVIPFKKFQGKKFKDVPLKDLAGYGEWIKTSVTRPSPDHNKFLALLEKLQSMPLPINKQDEEPPFPSVDELPF